MVRHPLPIYYDTDYHIDSLECLKALVKETAVSPQEIKSGSAAGCFKTLPELAKTYSLKQV